VTLEQSVVSHAKKERLDRHSVERTFILGDRVLIRTLGMDSKLVEACLLGPHIVLPVFTLVSYLLDTGRH